MWIWPWSSSGLNSFMYLSLFSMIVLATKYQPGDYTFLEKFLVRCFSEGLHSKHQIERGGIFEVFLDSLSQLSFERGEDRAGFFVLDQVRFFFFLRDGTGHSRVVDDGFSSVGCGVVEFTEVVEVVKGDFLGISIGKVWRLAYPTTLSLMSLQTWGSLIWASKARNRAKSGMRL